MTDPSTASLLAEIDDLKRKLDVSARWMKREVQQSAHKIVARKVTKMSENDRMDFMKENQEEIIANRIRWYFGELLLLNAPRNTVEYLIDSEISYFTLSKMPSGDGVSVVSSYNKILDSLIESIVTSGYRRFALKQGPVILRTNDPLEKALHLVISKKYTLSSGRIYGLIKALRNGEKLYEFGEYFKRYLDKYPTLRDLLMNDTFFKPYARLIESEVFGGKRHNGRISLEETTDARGILVGNYQDRDGLIYQLLLHASVLF